MDTVENGNVLVGQAFFHSTAGAMPVAGSGIFCGLRTGKFALTAKNRLLDGFCMSRATKSVVVDFFAPYFGGKSGRPIHRGLWKAWGVLLVVHRLGFWFSTCAQATGYGGVTPNSGFFAGKTPLAGGSGRPFGNISQGFLPRPV